MSFILHHNFIYETNLSGQFIVSFMLYKNVREHVDINTLDKNLKFKSL